MQTLSIHPLNIIKALSMALEFSINGMSRHHWRTAFICYCIAEHINLGEKETYELIYAALLHDIGAASSWSERRKISVASPLLVSNHKHAEEGYLLLKDADKMGQLADIIRHHHDNWDGTNFSRIYGEAIPLASRIINIADKIELLIKNDVPIFKQRNYILSIINKYSNICLDPKLVQVFNEIAETESFWLDLVNPNCYDLFFNKITEKTLTIFSLDDVIAIVNIFATIIDRTSKFTATHSRNVAQMAVFLAKQQAFSHDDLKIMEISGLLHDLGKLAVPNNILEKPAALTTEEFSIIKQHTYYTYRILQQIDGFDTIAQWAAYHHETLDGKGYPFRLKESEISVGSRIVAVADVFVALTENRPYRNKMEVNKVQNIIMDMVKQKKLDNDIVSLLFDNRQDAFALMAY